jgi:hypothetical protein
LSQTLYNPYQNRELLKSFLEPQIDAVASRKIQEQLKRGNTKDIRAFWYSPTHKPETEKNLGTGNKIHPRTIHLGETEDRVLPTFEQPIVDVDKYDEALTVANASGTPIHVSPISSSITQEQFDNVIGAFKSEWQEDAYNYLKAVQAGTITSQDFPQIKQVFTFAEVLNVEERMFVLPNAITTKQTNVLNIMVGEYNRFQISEDLGELDDVEARKGQYSTTQFTLRKAAGRIEYTDEHMMQNYLIDPLPTAMQNMMSDITRVKAKKIATVLATAGVTAGGANLTTLTANTEHSATNPLILLAQTVKGIWNNFGVASRAAMSQLTFDSYLSNTYVKPLLSAPQSLSPVQGVVRLPGFDQLEVYIDNSLPDGTLYIWAADAIWFLQGPIRTSTYRDELHGAQGVLYRDWHKPIVRKSTWLTQLNNLGP